MNQQMKKLTEVLNRFEMSANVNDNVATVNDMAMWDVYVIEWDEHDSSYTLRIKRDVPSWGGGRTLETKRVVKRLSAIDVVSHIRVNEDNESEY